MGIPFPPWLTWLIDNPARRLLIAPTTLADRLPLRPTDRVLEVGPGSGYFSVELARHVPLGHLELLDVQRAMLDKARRRLAAAGLTNAGATLTDAGAPLPLRAASFDVAVLVSVLGEVGEPEAAVRALGTVLRPGGVLAVHEHLPDPDMIALPRLRGLVEPHGFTLAGVHGPRWNYTAIFRRSRGSS